ncbi:MAG: histidine phosphatase family protein [Betaproteobacteria bacterium]|jgi:probable phosphoglycerate mutase
MTLALVRHGETAWNVEGRIQGHLDIPLNETGLAQAAAVGKRLRAENFDAVYSSDLIRAYQTAIPAVANPEQDIVREQRLRERHLGVLQGLTGDEAVTRQPQAWKAFRTRNADIVLAGGESLGEFFRRAVDFVEHILGKHGGQRILLVTHGGVLDAIYRHATAMPLSAVRDFPIYNASVNVISHDGARWKVESWGDISHLQQELAMDDS